MLPISFEEYKIRFLSELSKLIGENTKNSPNEILDYVDSVAPAYYAEYVESKGDSEFLPEVSAKNDLDYWEQDYDQVHQG